MKEENAIKELIETGNYNNWILAHQLLIGLYDNQGNKKFFDLAWNYYHNDNTDYAFPAVRYNTVKNQINKIINGEV